MPAYSTLEYEVRCVGGAMFQLGRTKVDGRAASQSPTTSANSDREFSADLRILGLRGHATWDEIQDAHARLVADLTPGPGASHRNVALATQLLDEVNAAFRALRARSSVA